MGHAPARRCSPNPAPPPRRPDPVEQLKRAYVRGTIDVEQLEDYLGRVLHGEPCRPEWYGLIGPPPLRDPTRVTR